MISQLEEMKRFIDNVTIINWVNKSVIFKRKSANNMIKKIKKNKTFFLYFIVLLLLRKNNDVKPWCSGFVQKILLHLRFFFLGQFIFCKHCFHAKNVYYPLLANFAPKLARTFRKCTFGHGLFFLLSELQWCSQKYIRLR